MGRLGLGLAVILILIVVRTYPRRAHDVAAKPLTRARQSRMPRGLRAAGHVAKQRTCELAARGKATSCRGKAAYNLVKYYVAFAFKLFYYVLFDL